MVSDDTSPPERDCTGQHARNTADTAKGEATGTRPNRRRRGTLSRQLIVERAIAIIDRDGVAGLTMRRLGEDLGVDAMSLYGYVAGRDDLLEAVVAHLVEQIQLHPHDRLHHQPDQPYRHDKYDQHDQPGLRQGWQAFLAWTAHSVRGIALAHPHLFPLIATRHPAAPWLRPPLRSLPLVEDFLGGLINRGFTPGQSIDIYRAFTSFLLGHLVLETASLGGATPPVTELLKETDADQPHDDADQPHDAEGDLDLSPYPALLSLRRQLAEDRSDAEFDRALKGALDLIHLHVIQ